MFNKLDVVHRSLCRSQCALHGNRPRHAAKHKNTIQTKSRLMGRIITTRRFVPICVCIFWLWISIHPVRNFSQSLAHTHGHEEQLGFSCSSLSLYDVAAAIHTVVKAPLRYQNTVASVEHCRCYFKATYFTSKCGQRCDYHQSRAWGFFFIPNFYFTWAFLCNMLVCIKSCFLKNF